MKFRFALVFSLLVILITAVGLFLFRSVSVSQIWKNYTVLYVDNTIPEQTVLSYLQNAGCKNVITISEQQIPLKPKYTPVYEDTGTYLSKRLSYFSDEASRYSVFYIPDVYQAQAGKALLSLKNETHADAGIDGKETYPYFIPLICTFVFFVLVLFSKDTVTFTLSGIFPVLLSFSMPFHSVAAGICLFLLDLYLVNILIGRRKIASVVLKKPYILILSFSSLTFFTLQSVLCGILGFLVMLSSISMIFIICKVRSYIDSKREFSFIPIFTAKQIPILFSKSIRICFFLILPLFALLMLFMLNSYGKPRISVNGVSLPAPVAEEENGILPVIEDYFEWAWNTMTYPYRSLNSDRVYSVSEGDSVFVEQYQMTDSGIKETKTPIYTYNEDFRTSLEKFIKEASYPAIEKLMLSQGRLMKVAYSGGGQGRALSSGPQDYRVLSILIIALLEPSLLVFIYYAGRKRK